MTKKIILLSVTLLGVILCLLIYHQYSRDYAPPAEQSRPAYEDITITKPDEEEMIETGPVRMGSEPIQVKIGRLERVHYVKRDENGRILQEFGFRERLSRGKKLLEFSEPFFRFHRKDRQLIEITAPLLSMPVEFAGGQRLPDRGSLKGGVRIEICRIEQSRPSASEEKGRRLTDFVVEMEKLDFQREFSQLTSIGQVRITGTQISAAGSDLTLQYDQVRQRLQELELRRLDHLRLKTTTPTQTKTAEEAEEKKEIEGTVQKGDKTENESLLPDERKTKKKKVEIYKLSLHQDVVVVRGQEELTADLVEILAEVGGSEEKRPDSAGLSGPRFTKEDEIKPAESAEEKEQEQEKEEEVIITCRGPLRIRPVDDVEPSAEGDKLELVAYGAPVRVRREKEEVLRAEQIRYNLKHKTVALRSGKGHQVWLSMGQGQYATADNEVIYDPCTGLTFNGRLLAATQKGQIEANQGHLTFYPSHPRDADSHKDPRKNDPFQTLRIKTVKLGGGVKIADPNTFYSSDKLQAYFDHNDQGDSQLNRILAQGAVRMENPDFLLEAQDNLQITFFDEQSDSSQAGATQDFLIDKPKESIGKTIEKIKNTRSQEAVPSLEQLLVRGRPEYILAKGAGGKVLFRDKKQKFEVKGDKLEGNANNGDIAKQGFWQIWGRPAEVKLAQQGNLQSKIIQIDLKTRYCTIPGEGGINALIADDLAGNAMVKPRPIEIKWLEGAGYSIDSNEVVAHEVTACLENQESDAIFYDVLSCPEMNITLRDEKKENKSKKRLSDLWAEGPGVRLVRDAYDPCTGGLMMRMEMEARRLHFDKAANLLTALGEGLIEISDYRPAPTKGDRDKKESLNNILSSSLGELGPAYTMIRFLNRMEYDLGTEKVFFYDDVGLRRLPISDQVAVDSSDQMNIPGLMVLDCDELEVARGSSSLDDEDKSKSKDKDKGKDEEKEKSTPSESSFDVGSLGYLRAEGNVVFEVIQSPEERHFFAGQTLLFDRQTNTVIAYGSEVSSVRFDQTQMLWLKYNIETGDFSGEPIGQSVVPD